MDTDSSGTPPTTTEARLALIDSSLARPFPVGEESEDSGVRSSGPGHHLLILRASRDFWDDRSPELVEPAEQEIETEFSAVATALSERWGEPETVDLWPYLERGRGRGGGSPGAAGTALQPRGQHAGLACAREHALARSGRGAGGSGVSHLAARRGRRDDSAPGVRTAPRGP